LITLARDEAAAYKSAYGERASVEMQAERMGAAMHIGTIAWYMRPYGAAMLLAGYDEDKKVPGTTIQAYCDAIMLDPTHLTVHVQSCIASNPPARVCGTLDAHLERVHVLPRQRSKRGSCLIRLAWRPWVKSQRCACYNVLPHVCTHFCTNTCPCSLHTVHDDTKDKPMEIEMSWISEASGWRHQFIPKDVQAEAITWAKAQIAAEEMGSDDDDDE
jgi:hypothetical protein